MLLYHRSEIITMQLSGYLIQRLNMTLTFIGMSQQRKVPNESRMKLIGNFGREDSPGQKKKKSGLRKIGI